MRTFSSEFAFQGRQADGQAVIVHEFIPSPFFLTAIFMYTLLSLSGNSGCLTWVRLQQEQERRYPVLQVRAGSFRVSVIHRTRTRTTLSLTYVRDHSCACVYIQGLGSSNKTGKIPACILLTEGSIYFYTVNLNGRLWSCVTSVAKLSI